MSTSTDVSTERLGASLALVAATRELMLAAATTDADVVTVRDVCAVMEELTRRIGPQDRPRVTRTPFDGPARARAAGPDHVWNLYALNPGGIALSISFGVDDARARVIPNALHEGPPDCLHGGISAHLMDCMLGALLRAHGHRALTASLDMRYLQRTPLDHPLDLSARIVESVGRKIVVEGWIEHDGERTVEARGLFVTVANPPCGGAPR